jgi:flavin-dependent dehydrogenase
VRRTAALIVGGGPAGTAAAILLARGGVRPLLIERDRETGDALCGGFLSWHTLATLRRIGVDTEALGGAPIDRVRLFAGGRSAGARLPAPAVGLSRRRLDSALIDLALRHGVAIERGVAARAAEGLSLRLDDGATISGEALLLATGKHDLRGLARPRAGDDPALGLRVHLGPDPGLTALIGTTIELHAFDRGYAGLQMQEDGRANLCMAVRKSRLAEAGSPAALIAALGRECPALGERLAYLPAAPHYQAIGAVPYGWRAAAGGETGLFRLGDQAGVIPSLAGEGVGIALASGVLAAAALIAGGPGAATRFQADFRRRLARPVLVADAIRGLAERGAGAQLLVAATGIVPALAGLAARATRIDSTPH